MFLSKIRKNVAEKNDEKNKMSKKKKSNETMLKEYILMHLIRKIKILFYTIKKRKVDACEYGYR